jgi:hypothetical protein
MEPNYAGAHVFCIEGRKLGVVDASRSCCIGIHTVEGTSVAVLHNAVMSGDSSRVSLVCGRTGVARYSCPTHQPSHIASAI